MASHPTPLPTDPVGARLAAASRRLRAAEAEHVAALGELLAVGAEAEARAHGALSAASAHAPALLKIDQAATHLSTNRDQVYAWIRAGRLPMGKIGARTVVHRDDCEALAREIVPTPDVDLDAPRALPTPTPLPTAGSAFDRTGRKRRVARVKPRELRG